MGGSFAALLRSYVVRLPADARRRWQLVFRAPGKQPRLHILVADVMSSFELAVGIAKIAPKTFLIGKIRLHSIRNQEIGAAA